MKRKAKPEQILHINRMFLDGGLTRAQFEEANAMAQAGGLTFEVAEAITKGKFPFQSRLSDLHLAKARRVWETLGKKVLGLTFNQYVKGKGRLAGVPLVGAWPEPYLTAFDRDVLVDGRIEEKVGRKELCKLAKLIYTGEDNTLESYDVKLEQRDLRWIRCQDGHKNRNRKPSDCRSSLAAYEVGMDATEGVFTYVDDPSSINDHHMDLIGSVHRDGRDGVACLGVIGGKPGLDWNWDGNAHPSFGAASRGSESFKP